MVVIWIGFVDFESGIRQISWVVGEDFFLFKLSVDDFYIDVIVDDLVGGVVISN